MVRDIANSVFTSYEVLRVEPSDWRKILFMQLTNLPSSSWDKRLCMIYVHIPFCTSKCHFCDWVQAISKGELLLKPKDERRRRYIDALTTEIRVRGRELTTAGYIPYILYWGGGTASSLDESEAEAVMSALKDSFRLDEIAEATIECSPETVSAQKLRSFRRMGFNRFSSGVQSLRQERLRILGRSHSADRARDVVNWAKEAGFEHINIDLMCGFPDESLTEVEQTIKEGLKLPINHLSIYAFRPTPGTLLRSRMTQDKADSYLESELISFTLARRLAKEAGLPEYAVGYFGAPALNVVMPFQLRLETIGFGSGAVSLLDGNYYGHNKGFLEKYIMDPLSWDFESPVAAPSVMFSILRSGLSVYDGILRREWFDRTGISLDEALAAPSLKPALVYLRETGKLIEDERGLRLPKSTAPHVIVALAFHGSMTQMQACKMPKLQRSSTG